MKRVITSILFSMPILCLAQERNELLSGHWMEKTNDSLLDVFISYPNWTEKMKSNGDTTWNSLYYIKNECLGLKRPDVCNYYIYFYNQRDTSKYLLMFDQELMLISPDKSDKVRGFKKYK